MTIAKEKMSASLLGSCPSKTSGAAHRGVLPCREALRMVSMVWVTLVRPKSVMRACLELSTRIFTWPRVNVVVERGLETTHSLEVPMNHVAEVEVAESLGNVGQLVAGVSVG